MQRSISIAAAAAAIALGCALGAPSARAVEANFPYCATPTWSEGLDCDYQSFQQCAAAVAGFNRTCVANPGFTTSQAQLPAAPRKRIR
jgi:hypothetical protein